MPVEPRDNEKKQVVITEEDDNRLVHVVRRTEIPPKSERFVLVETDERGLVQLGPLLEWDSTHAWKKASGIIHAFQNRPFNVIFLNLTNALYSLANHQRIATAFPPLPSPTIGLYY